MSKLISFHGDPAIKQKFVSRLEDHRRLERLIQGTGWRGGEPPKGCAVGCTLNKYDHKAYEVELGLPEWLAKLEDKLFEALPKCEAEQFAIDFLNVIPVGVNVDCVRHQLAILRQELALDRLKDYKEPYAVECRNAIQLVIAYHNRALKGTDSESAAWSARSARSAAWSAAESAAESAESAAWSAESAAWSAAWSARSAAWSAAESAESAAWSAAWSAWSAAWSARSAHYKWETATLLKFLSECK